MEIEKSEEEIDLIKSSEEMLAKHPTKKILIYSIHALLIQFEAHLDSIIKRYKIMSITLLAATGAAIGFSFSGEFKDVQVNKLIIVSAICIFGMIGISAIWYLDLQVFHKFWASFFLEEVKMEEKYSFLVDVGDVEVSLDNIKARLIGDGNWYIFLNVILATAATVVLSFVTDSILRKIGIFLFGGLLIFGIVELMNKSSKKLLNVFEQMLSTNES